MSRTRDLTLVVPTYRRAESLASLLDDLGRLTPAPAAVIVVAGDDASADLARAYPVTVLRVPNRNAGSSRNHGWRAATTEYVGFLDDDCSPYPDWVQAAGDALQASGAVAVGGPVSNPRPESLLARVAQQWLERRYEGGPADWLATQNLVVRRDVLEALDGFDEDLVAYEDVDFGLRARDAGGLLVRVPAMDVAHEHRATVRGLWRQHRGYGRGFVQLARKHPSWDQAQRAPLSALSLLRALALALLRPVRCALEMPRPLDRGAAFPLFALREVAFLSGALAERRR